MVLDFTIVNVALPSIQDGLHVATTTLQWVVSAYAVAFGGLLLLGGRLADAAGRARLFRAGLVVFVVGSIAGGLAVEPGVLIASRVVQGTGAAMLAPASLSRWLPAGRRAGTQPNPGLLHRGRLRGLRVGRSAGRPPGRGYLAPGLLGQRAGGPGAAGGLDATAAGRSAPARRAAGPSRRGERNRRGSPAGACRRASGRHTTRHSACAAGGGGDRVARRVRRMGEGTPTPPLDLGLPQARGILGANMCLIAVGTISAGEVLVVALYLQQGRGRSPLMSGLCFIPQAAAAFALSGPAARLIPALGPRRALAVAIALSLRPWPTPLSRWRTVRWPPCWARWSCSASRVASTRSRPTSPAPTGPSPPGPPHPHAPPPQHLFRHHAGGIP